jgi:hypothetical protein
MLRLPQEIRDIISEQIWTHSKPFVFRYRQLRVMVSSSGCRNPSSLFRIQHGLPDWLLACKQILLDGLAALHRTQTFVALSRTAYGPWYPIAPPLRTNNSLLFNKNIKYIQYVHSSATVSKEGAEAKLYWYNQIEDVLFAAYLDSVHATPQSLLLNLYIYDDSPFVSLTGLSESIAAIKALSCRCQTVTFTLELGHSSGTYDAHTTALLVVDAVEHCAESKLELTGRGMRQKVETRVRDGCQHVLIHYKR